jgi:hypothetical protein
MESSFHSLTPFLPLVCNCQFRRLDWIQFLCSQAHIPAGWRPETRLFTSRLLFHPAAEPSLQPLCTDHAENTASIVKEVCLPRCCLAIDVLFIRTFDSAGMCLPSHCIAMCISAKTLSWLDRQSQIYEKRMHKWSYLSFMEAGVSIPCPQKPAKSEALCNISFMLVLTLKIC